MKNWLPSSILLTVGLFSGLAFAGAIDNAHRCLDNVDLRCAIDILQAEQVKDSNAPEVLHLKARILFHEGQYSESVEVLEQLEKMGELVEDTGAFPARATQGAFLGMVEAQGNQVVVRHDPGLDRILAEDALETLEASRQTYDTLFGSGPDHDLVMDIFPTAQRFIAASGIPPEAVRTTGVIALSKWNRLLLTSPRATARGYSWQDTAAHEYIHLVVAWSSKDNAPVWLQEGLAKYLERAWRGERQDYLSVHQQSLLAGALKDDAFVPFEKFAQSMAYLDSGEEAALAFAQVASMVDFFQSKAGDAGFPILMQRLAKGEKAEVIVSDLSGFSSFDDFKEGWKRYIAAMPLIMEELNPAPIALDGSGGEFADDPVLSRRVDLAKYVRLGDLLMEKGFYEAAIVEYQKAQSDEESPSPNVLVRLALCYQKMQKSTLAQKNIDEALHLFPEHSLVLTSAAELYDELGQDSQAYQYWEWAHDINPYDVKTQHALIRLYGQSNQPELQQRHQRYAEILAKGGAYLEEVK